MHVNSIIWWTYFSWSNSLGTLNCKVCGLIVAPPTTHVFLTIGTYCELGNWSPIKICGDCHLKFLNQTSNAKATKGQKWNFFVLNIYTLLEPNLDLSLVQCFVIVERGDTLWCELLPRVQQLIILSSFTSWHPRKWPRNNSVNIRIIQYKETLFTIWTRKKCLRIEWSQTSSQVCSLLSLKELIVGIFWAHSSIISSWHGSI